ncbi:MAG: phosphate transport system permease protein [Gammaproteobacteria bacterium]|jgi:phosphate transport system permease protein
MESETTQTKLQLENSHRRWRTIKDRLFGWTMAVGGIGVIITIVMIFFYLFYVVLPIFGSASTAPLVRYDSPFKGSPIAHLSLDEYAEIGFVITADGEYAFFTANNGVIIDQGKISNGAGSPVVAIAAGDPVQRTITVAFEDRTVIVVRPEYAISYPNDKRRITPTLEYPFGSTPVELGQGSGDISMLAAQAQDNEMTIVSVTDAKELTLTNVTLAESFLVDEPEVTTTHVVLPNIKYDISHLLIDVDQRELYVASAQGQISYFNISNKRQPQLLDLVNVLPNDLQLTTLEYLSGGISILVGDSSGTISQWFPVRDDNNNYTIQQVRSFAPFTSSVSIVVPEYFRKGFVAADEAGNFALIHTTAGRILVTDTLATNSLHKLAISPRADALLFLTGSGEIEKHAVHNEHPEISWNSIWGKVWYESRAEPEYIWQSSSASGDFEPKFSLTPLTFGTLKAALYAMLFAIPLAILGAIYTAYFMTPKMRNFVKPSVEVMAALPTVILGFLAGLWLAPLIEQYLAGVILAFFVVPFSFIFAAFVIDKLPPRARSYFRNGWESAVLLPIVCLGIWLSLSLSLPIETALFDGSLPVWLSENFGISYDQRNSLVVGMAIGFAVIPTIFSISEDAVFGVPGHLTSGSLALGATPWQTMIGVVILTASPGIFSAVMIGLGRAVGETMIVLMATGNTPIMEINIFEGFRALSANIAVEMPESEVNSTHFRVLFLAALVLFMVTFVVNTVAEIVRQRLRVKYSNL